MCSARTRKIEHLRYFAFRLFYTTKFAIFFSNKWLFFSAFLSYRDRNNFCRVKGHTTRRIFL
jgi:hypothetical protein